MQQWLALSPNKSQPAIYLKKQKNAESAAATNAAAIVGDHAKVGASATLDVADSLSRKDGQTEEAKEVVTAAK